jgi:hypothetical protein
MILKTLFSSLAPHKSLIMTATSRPKHPGNQKMAAARSAPVKPLAERSEAWAEHYTLGVCG